MASHVSKGMLTAVKMSIAIATTIFMFTLLLSTTVLCLLTPQFTIPFLITAAVIALATVVAATVFSVLVVHRLMNGTFNFGSSSSQNINASVDSNDMHHTHNNSTKHMHTAFGTTGSATSMPTSTPPAAAATHSHSPLRTSSGMWTMPVNISFESDNSNNGAFTPS